MIVSLDEFKADLDRYLELVGEEKLVVTKDGKRFVTVLDASEPSPSEKVALIHSLIGTLPSTVTVEDAKAERLAKYEAGL